VNKKETKNSSRVVSFYIEEKKMKGNDSTSPRSRFVVFHVKNNNNKHQLKENEMF
jgi:hypothetical protein